MGSKDEISEEIWDVMKIYQYPKNYKYALIILNQKILLPEDYVLPLWEKATVTVTVDGGTNFWFEYIGECAADVLSGCNTKYLPTMVTGDMDSIKPNLLEKLKKTKTKVIVTPDVMETDYTKSLMQLYNYITENQIKLDGIHVLTEMSGRFDHIISQINTLHKCNRIVHKIPVVQMTGGSLIWLLQPGNHKILIPDSILQAKSWCSLIPFGNSNNCVITKGLKWDLNKRCMKFGELISTSNSFSGQSEVKVTTDVPLVWSMSIEVLTKIYLE
ncbi:thiamin pyrophosphokinase 1 [Trichogramma pretiosum]|uniref:thiamin pyrophosphokinase 1 n=1 Tax=Trichogramma pretiosum TaxID=7493 RepID=UPI0006C9E1B6|nr:thiamin pyrophosphokinase 1 [Trichogramma pretiosum]